MPGICLDANARQITQASEIGGVTGASPAFAYFGTGVNSTGLFTPSIAGAGTYPIKYVYTSNRGCKDSTTTNITVWPSPTAKFGISNPTCEKNAITFSDTSVANYSNIVSWNWVAPGSDEGVSILQNPRLNYPDGETGEYMIYLTVTDDLGCTDTTSVKVIVLSDVLAYIPNAFTPDGDEHNQVWKYSFSGIETSGFSMYIYNRWGEMIWECHNPNETWDGTYGGKPVQQGLYVWKAEFGVINTDERRTINGFVNLIR
jgi:gliding motility-associated-like protein